MEEHRLSQLPKNYDKELFNEIYRKTSALRRRLVSQIDHTRFGVEKEDISSWLDVKFIFTFTKYYGEEPEILKAYIINALQFFKNRILRYSYSHKNSVNLNTMDIEDAYYNKETQFEWSPDERDFYLAKAMEFLRDKLSKEALNVLQIEINPPPYILKRIPDKKDTTKIPSNLIGEYLGLDDLSIRKLKKEIKDKLVLAREHFDQIAHYI